MSNPEQCAQLLDEKQILQDALISQKQITDSYNTYAAKLSIPSSEAPCSASLTMSIPYRRTFQLSPVPRLVSAGAGRAAEGRPGKTEIHLPLRAGGILKTAIFGTPRLKRRPEWFIFRIVEKIFAIFLYKKIFLI
jgi:hypothetical protein